MQLNREERKAELASYLVKVLESLKLTRTASTLRQEAKLIIKPNISEEVAKIKESTAEDHNKQKELIHRYFMNYLKKLIRENCISEALKIFQNCLPDYVDDLEPFSLLFATTEVEEKISIDSILQKILTENSGLPEKRVSCLQYEAQIWMLEVLGDSILAIDQTANARVIRDDIVIAERLKLHDSQIFCVGVNNEDSFATGSLDKTCKIWSSKLQLLYELSKHSQRVTSICFINNQMASFDRAGVIIVTKEVPKVPSSRNSLPHFKLKGIPYNDVKYISSKNCIIGAGTHQNQGRIDLSDLQNRTCTAKLILKQRIYNIELSQNQKIVFANLNSMNIHAYSTSSFELRFKISGFQQHQCLMRMSIGGPNGDLLAVTSEEGCVCVFSIKKKEIIGKIKGLSGKTVNCVKWKHQQLFFGCDGGFIEHWVPLQVSTNDAKLHSQESQHEIQQQFSGNQPNSQELQQLE